ncbi:MAG: WYL domain-containing protein [Bacteroidales bacterium]|nr:WYL domain-containing protein [Bacteroidales bacterium]
MNPYLRYRIINSLLVNGRNASAKEMMDACKEAIGIEISKRTIEKDLENMRHDTQLNFQAPIVYDHYLKAYKYSDPGYTIDSIGLNDDEVETLKFAATILKQFQHTAFLEKYEGAVQKIINAINESHLANKDYDMSFIEFESAPLVKGTEHLEPLIEHIKEKHVLKTHYRSFDSEEPKKYTLHPHLLKEYRNRWYLVAWHEEDRKFKTFGLDRIQSMERTFMKTFHTGITDFERLFRDSVGITRFEKDPEEIVVAFTKRQASYIATQPLHETQMLLRYEQDRYVFSFTIVPTFEFTAALLGWGAEVEVLGPEWYRKELIDRIIEMEKLYKL